MTDAKQVPLPTLQAAAGVLEGALQTLDSNCLDWTEPNANAWLREHRDLRDWLNANGVKVTEYACSKHQALFDQYLRETAQ